MLKAVKTVARKVVNLAASLVVTMVVRSAQSLVVHWVATRAAQMVDVKAEKLAAPKVTCWADLWVGW